jgi:hypothetical protein
MKNWLIFLVIPLGALLLFSTGFYTYWNHADPRSTCASCHEITPSVSTWEHSAHRDVPCFDCHGTALGNGIHSLKEKANMVFTHFREDVHSGEIRLSEDQVLEMQARCAGCHQSEQARWSAGGHATVYERIFLDSVHNTREQLYWDCFRCHGMYYAGNIYDLVTPVSTQGPWSLREPAKAGQPLIPCLACHQMHSANEPLRTGTGADERNPACGLYLRSDKMHLRADLLPMPSFREGIFGAQTSKVGMTAGSQKAHSSINFSQKENSRACPGISFQLEKLRWLTIGRPRHKAGDFCLFSDRKLLRHKYLRPV